MAQGAGLTRSHVSLTTSKWSRRARYKMTGFWGSKHSVQDHGDSRAQSIQYKITQVLGFRAFGEDDMNSERFDG